MLQAAPGREAPDALSRAQEVALPLIGRPWKAGADGPDAFDCYGLVRHVLREAFGVELPNVERPDTALTQEQCTAAIQGRAEMYEGCMIDAPRHGAVLLTGRDNEPSHVGIFLALPPVGGVLHADQRMGQVVFEDLHRMRVRGYVSFRWYMRPA